MEKIGVDVDPSRRSSRTLRNEAGQRLLCQTFGVRLRVSPTVEYHSQMQIASGTIVGGKVVVEGLSLPDGTPVTVLARGDEVAVRLPLDQEAELLDALDEADREDGISAEELFARLRRFG